MARSSDSQPADAAVMTLSLEPDSPLGAAAVTGRHGPPENFHGYRLLDWLGAGAMGEVYLARDLQLQRDVAIKFVKREGIHAENFVREAHTAASLQHNNIASVYNVGRIGDRPYIVSEYVRGDSLQASALPMPWRRALDIGLALSRGVAAMHRRGILHHDIKPANVVLSESGEPKLVDFGLAKFVDEGAALSAEPVRAHDAPAEVPPAATGATDDLPADDLGPSGAGSAADASARDSGSRAPGTRATSTFGRAFGTPHYIPPEIWREEEPAPSADIYALGVLLYKLCSGRVPFTGAASIDAIKRATIERDAPPLARVAPAVDIRLASIVDRCLERDPQQRFQSGDQLRDALEKLVWAERAYSLPEGSPYLGLAAFESKHRGLFFGRDRDLRNLLDRLRHQRLVVVVGQSGVGKSSLLRAGLMPLLEQRGVDSSRVWAVHAVLVDIATSSLAHVLAQRLELDEDLLRAAMDDDFMAASRRLRAHHGNEAGTVLCIDHLEDLLGGDSPQEIEHLAAILGHLVEHTPGTRVLATVRADKVAELAALPGLGPLIERSLYFLRPLDSDAIRKTIVRPAQAKGVRFESEELIESLVAATRSAQGSLPLLQFALTRLWELRDRENRQIAAAALERIGGVGGALVMHADGVMAEMVPSTRVAAEACLLRLVSPDNTRTRRSEEFLCAGDPIRRQALDALVHGRLLVVQMADGETQYEIVHDALISRWTRLRHLLDQEGGLRAVKERLAQAADEWHQNARARDLLWRGQRLRDAVPLHVAQLPPQDGAFLAASRRKRRRDRWWRRLAWLSPVLLMLLGYGTFLVLESLERARFVRARLVEARTDLQRADQLESEYLRARERAFELFREHRLAEAERRWASALAIAPRLERAYADVRAPLDAALRRDPARDDVRAELAEVLDRRVRLAGLLDRAGEQELLATELQSYDRVRAERWRQAPELEVTTVPAGLSVTVAGYRDDRNGRLALTPVAQSAQRTPARWTLPPGSYLLHVAASDRTVALRYPLLLRGGDRNASSGPVRLSLSVPAPEDVPQGLIAVAPGAFLYGYGSEPDVEDVRLWYLAQPLHERHTEGFLIARHETTFADWMAFLRALPPERRAVHLPDSQTQVFGATVVRLRELAGGFELEFGTIGRSRRAREGQPFHYPGRANRSQQDWSRFPVTGVALDSVRAYLAWLDGVGLVPGARLCREDEWERAVRGADGRLFAHGDRLAPDDANHDATQGEDQALWGLDEVGQHPVSESPLGLHDAIGNAAEMTLPLGRSGQRVVVRSGAYYWSRRTNVAANRQMLGAGRLPHVGFRVCAPWPGN